MRKVHRHALPENNQYLWEDHGCEYHDACLTCPFAVCIKHEFSTKIAARAAATAARDREIVALFRAGHSAVEIAARYGIHKRTVPRAIARGRAVLAVPGPNAHLLRQS